MKASELDLHTKIAAGVIFVEEEDKRFLLLLRSDYVPSSNSWSLPGGKGERDETPVITAKRETNEEIGYDLTDKKLSLIYVNEEHWPKFKFYTYGVVVAKAFKPQLNYENSDYIWCDLDSLPENLHWGIKQMLRNKKAMKKLRKLTKSVD